MFWKPAVRSRVNPTPCLDCRYIAALRTNQIHSHFPFCLYDPIGDCNPASGDINQPTRPPTSPLRNGIPSPLAPQFKLALQIETKSQSAPHQKHHHPSQPPALHGPNWELELKTNGHGKRLTHIVLISNISDDAGDQRNINKSHPCRAWRPAEVLVTI